MTSSASSGRARLAIPAVVRNKAAAVGAPGWIDDLPPLVADIEREWSIRVGRPYQDATEAFVARATLADGSPAVLKLLIPRAGAAGNKITAAGNKITAAGNEITAAGNEITAAGNEITVLRLTGGDGCVRLLRADAARGALLLERLGRSLHELGLPMTRRHEILSATAARVWRPAPESGLPTGADKGRWLAGFIVANWEELDRPCSERAVSYALACAARRIAAHDDERAVLVHGDVHEWNALEAGGGFKLVDPDGLLAEAEYDMGIVMREDPVELMGAHPRQRARWLARRTGLDAAAIWEWGVVERVSTGLLGTRIGLQPVARQMLAAADHVAE